MAKLRCDSCETAFNSDDFDPRCPTCLRRSTVVGPNRPFMMGADGPPKRRPFWPRFAAAFASCTVLFFGLTMGGKLMGMPLTWGWRLYGVLLGGGLLALLITLVQLPGMFAVFGPYGATGRDDASQ